MTCAAIKEEIEEFKVSVGIRYLIKLISSKL